jgi:hypothetical protein
MDAPYYAVYSIGPLQQVTYPPVFFIDSLGAHGAHTTTQRNPRGKLTKNGGGGEGVGGAHKKVEMVTFLQLTA